MALAGQDHLYDKVELAGPSIDPHSKGVATLSTVHALTHAGKVFHMARKITGVANAATIRFLLKVGANSVHMTALRMSTGGGDIDILGTEGDIVSADGTPLPVYNTNRNSLLTPTMTLFATPTVTTPGTEIHNIWLPPTGGGVGQQSGQRDASAGEEWILKPNMNYVHSLTNNSGGVISVWMEMLWYEGTP